MLVEILLNFDLLPVIGELTLWSFLLGVKDMLIKSFVLEFYGVDAKPLSCSFLVSCVSSVYLKKTTIRLSKS